MSNNNRKRNAFRPELSGGSLEERVVLSLPPGYNFVSSEQAAQFRAAFGRAFRSTQLGVRTQIQNQARQLFASGTPTAQQIANFEANADGTIAAGTSAIANMFTLLPGAQKRLVPSTARALLANNQSSLLSQVHNLVNNTNVTSSLHSLETALRQNISSAFGNVGTQAAQFLANQNLNTTVLEASDGSDSLSQLIGDRIISQFANNLGNLALAFPNVANSVLFANGATTASPSAVQQFNQMVTPALESVVSNLGNELQLLPHGTSLFPSIQNSIFGTTTSATGTTSTSPTSLLAALQGLPTGSSDFANAIPTTFSTALTNLAGILQPFVGTFPSPNITLPIKMARGPLGSSFTGSTFQSGFLGGFGSGFTGFGAAPTTLNSNFGTGFNNFVSTTNSGMGFSTPTTTSGTGTGGAGTVGVTTGNGTTSTGTGTTSGNGTSG